jgi:hypothetical protein
MTPSAAKAAHYMPAQTAALKRCATQKLLSGLGPQDGVHEQAASCGTGSQRLKPLTTRPLKPQR